MLPLATLSGAEVLLLAVPRVAKTRVTVKRLLRALEIAAPSGYPQASRRPSSCGDDDTDTVP